MLSDLRSVPITYGSVISIVTAIIINRFTYYFSPVLYPPNLRQSDDWFLRWKWRNFFISFIHSLVTGFGSLFCVMYRPRLLIEVIDEYLEAAYLLTSFSHGYFIYDLIEMLTNSHYKGSKELVIHHILILFCFSLTVFQHKYCGYSSIALLIELSNIFLHFRQLLIISKTSKSSTFYRANCYLNIIVYVLVRVSCLIWLWLTLLWVLPRVPLIEQIIAFVTLTSICGMTVVLFFRIYRSDFSKKAREQSGLNGENGVNSPAGAQALQAKEPEKQINGLISNPKLNEVHSKTS